MAKVQDGIDVSLFDPENGTTTRKFVTELKKCSERQLRFTSLDFSVPEPRETVTQLAVVVRSTTRRFEDDIDNALAQAKEEGYELPYIVIYFHTNGDIKDCSETDNHAKLMKKYNRIKIIDMDFSRETFCAKRTFWLSGVNKSALSLLKTSITSLANAILEKKLFVLDKTKSKQTKIIIKELKEMMPNQLQIEEVEKWRENEPVAVIFDQDLRSANSEICFEEFKERNTSNTILLRLQTEQTSDTSVQDTGQVTFGQIININGAKERYFINFDTCKELIAFVKCCNMQRKKDSYRKEDDSNMSVSLPKPDNPLT